MKLKPTYLCLPGKFFEPYSLFLLPASCFPFLLLLLTYAFSLNSFELVWFPVSDSCCMVIWGRVWEMIGSLAQVNWSSDDELQWLLGSAYSGVERVTESGYERLREWLSGESRESKGEIEMNSEWWGIRDELRVMELIYEVWICDWRRCFVRN